MARSDRHNSVLLSLAVTDVESVRGALTSIEGGAGVDVLEQGADRTAIEVLAADGAQLAAPVSELAQSRGWSVHALSVERGRLDDVFREITAAGGGSNG